MRITQQKGDFNNITNTPTDKDDYLPRQFGPGQVYEEDSLDDPNGIICRMGRKLNSWFGEPGAGDDWIGPDQLEEI